MKFAGFIKKHWKAAAAIFAIMVATTVGVVAVRAATITLNVDRQVINFNSDSEVVTVNATVSIFNASATNGTFAWATADPNIAVVSASEGIGTVSARAAGKTNLTVGYYLDGDSEIKTIPVTVPLVVYYDAVSMIMQPGNEGAVSCNAAASRNVVWTSANSNIATVTPTGNKDASIKAISGGKTQITASIPEDGLSYSFDVTVGVTVDEDEIEVEQGQTKVLTTNSNSVADVYWWSDNENVVTVANGVVTGVYAGSTTIYASCVDGDASNNAGDTVTVTVPYRITKPATTVLVGDSITIPNTANPSEVNYASSNNNIISYDAKTGMFTAHDTGEAVLTVTWNGNTEPVTINVIDGLSLSNTSTALNIGTSDTIKAIVSNTEEPVSWKIADPSMVELSVSEDGLSATVTALATGATASTTLVATQVINGVVKTATCEVYVLNPVKSLTLLYNGNEIKDVISIQRGNGVYITAFLNFGEAVVPDNTKLSWISSDPAILTVSPVTDSGQQQLCLVSGVKGGNATITVVSEDGLYIATADFYVTEGVTSIELDTTNVTAQMALQKFQLTATVHPSIDGVDTSVTWASLDPNVLTVDQNGLVTFVGPGETYVSATSNADTTKVAYCKFLITQQVEQIKMDFDKVTLSVGDEYRLTAVIKPDNATNKNVKWSTSNPGVVTVDENGMLKAVGSGSATVIVQTEDGGYIDMTNVTVLQPVSSITLSQTEMSVKKGTVFWLNATVSPDTADNKKVTWSSSDTSLATVDADGKVTTLAVGTVTISCVSEDNGTVAYCVVEITEPVTGLTLNAYYQEMVAGTKFVVLPTVLPIDAPNKDVTFISSDPEVATVDENGVVTALVGGTCEIIVTTVESNLKATCTISVKEYVESIEISGNPERLNVGDSVTLVATVGTDTASNKTVLWTSSNPNIATVDQNGKVTGHSPGNVVITATAADGGGVSDSVIIKVINPVTSITFDKSKITMYVGDTVNIQATVNPANATIKELEWYSDDESIAKVYSDGDVVGIAPGRTVVYAKSTDGNEVVARCTVIVKEIIRASSVSINSTEVTMLKGKTRKLIARLYPTNTNEHVNWLSTDTSIVQVDANGNIVTVGAGTCEVIAYSSAGTVEDSCIIHSVAMHFTDIRIEQYDTFNLYVDGNPEAVSWRTSNPRIATVTQNGVVTGRMPGECVITATVQGKTVTCYVKVMAVDPGKFINRD
ncbi:MAG: Ig-like domain-containing protein [Butyrivibrio sp.]|nr:Ig-like domain-containing protein [Butyrivibrio sp.]